MKWLAALGMLMLLISIGAGGAVGCGKAAQFNWNTVKPGWLLIREAMGQNNAKAVAAIKELDLRLGAKDFPATQAAAIVDRGLEYQADFSLPWRVSWGSLIEHAINLNLTTKDQFARYARHAINPKLEVRAKVRVRDPIPLELISETRVGSGGLVMLVGEHQGIAVDGTLSWMGVRTVNESGVALKFSTARPIRIPLMGTLASKGRTRDPDSVVVQGTGKHVVTSRWVFAMYRSNTPNARSGMSNVSRGPLVADTAWSSDPNWAIAPDDRNIVIDSLYAKEVGEKLVQWRCEVSASFEAVSEGTDTVEVATNPTIDAAVKSVLSSPRASIVSGDNWVSAQGSIHVAADPPICLAFDVYWRVGRDERWVGRAIMPTSKGDSDSLRYEQYVKDANVDRVDVVLRACPEAARATTSMTRIWGGEIVFPEVAVKAGSPPFSFERLSPK